MIPMEQRWAAVRAALDETLAVTWDGCHKIYLLLDTQQIREFDSFGYELTPADDADATLELLREWYEVSCFLRFVQSVRSDPVDPNRGFTNLIPQGAEEDDE